MTDHKLDSNYVQVRGKNAGKKFRWRCSVCLRKWVNLKPAGECKGNVKFGDFATKSGAKTGKSGSSEPRSRTSSGFRPKGGHWIAEKDRNRGY